MLHLTHGMTWHIIGRKQLLQFLYHVLVIARSHLIYPFGEPFGDHFVLAGKYMTGFQNVLVATNDDETIQNTYIYIYIICCSKFQPVLFL